MVVVSLTKYDKSKLFEEFVAYLEENPGHIYIQQKDIIPISIFSKNLSPFESLVKFLVEEYELSYASIGKKFGKSRQSVWTTYNRAIKKHSLKFTAHNYDIVLPLDIFENTPYTIFEIVVSYLKEKYSLRNIEIAKLLHKDTKTIWTVYNRYKNKNEKKKS